MLRIAGRVSSRTSLVRTGRPSLQRAATGGTKYAAWKRDSAFGDRGGAGPRSAQRFISYSRRSYSQANAEALASRMQSHGGPAYRLRKLDDERQAQESAKILDSIAHHKPPSPYQPRTIDFNRIDQTYPEKKTREKFQEIDKMLTRPASADAAGIQRASGAGNLHTSFHAVAEAETIFLCTGSNSADGKPQLDGPIATALLAYSLYQVHKAAIIVADRNNLMLVRSLMEHLNRDAAEHIRYVEVNAVNGALVNAMHRLIGKHKPQAIIHVGVPGRASDGLYYDAEGNFVGEYNMAVDQAMNLANAYGTMTIAFGNALTQAGMNGASGMKPQADKQTGLRAVHQIPGASATSGALALSSLLMAAYKNADLCSSDTVLCMIATGKNAQAKERFDAQPVARSGDNNGAPPIYKRDASAVRAREHQILEQASRDFPSIQQMIHAERLPWPQHIEEQHLYGAKQRYISAVDSSDGVLTAAKRFWNLVRARSPYELRMLLVADHSEAPYGSHLDEKRRILVYRMLRYTAQQATEVIVMMCNTANLEDIEALRHQLEAEAAAKGRNTEIHIIDLIKHTAEAIVARGGPRVVLLSTQATAEKEKYSDSIRKAAKDADAAPPAITRIGCGNRNDPRLKEKDWASLVNKGYYLDSMPGSIKAMLKEEINRYVDQIPLDSTSVWLCCTHFPALRTWIDARLQKRLRKAGCSHAIPIFDPMEDQADATIEKLRSLDKGQRPDYSGLPRYSIHTTGLDIEVKSAAIRHGIDDAVVQTIDFDGRQDRERAATAQERTSPARRARARHQPAPGARSP